MTITGYNIAQYMLMLKQNNKSLIHFLHIFLQVSHRCPHRPEYVISTPQI